MTSSQANPAYSSTTDDSNPSNPITSGSSHKPTFAERHKAPTTKDVESNKWVFGSQQAVSGPGDHSADDAGTDLGGLGFAGDGSNMTAGTAAAGPGASSRMGVESGGAVRSIQGENEAAGNTEQGFGGVGGQERYLAERQGQDFGTGGNGEVAGYQQGETGDFVGGDGFTGTTGGGAPTAIREHDRPLGSTTGVYEGVPGREQGGSGLGVGEGEGEEKKKMNPLKKVVEAVKNI